MGVRVYKNLPEKKSYLNKNQIRMKILRYQKQLFWKKKDSKKISVMNEKHIKINFFNLLPPSVTYYNTYFIIYKEHKREIYE